MFLETSLAEAEGGRPAPTGPKLLDLRLGFPAGPSLGITWTGGERQPPDPPGLGPVAALRGEDSELALGVVAVDALIHAAKPVDSFSPHPGAAPGDREGRRDPVRPEDPHVSSDSQG